MHRLLSLAACALLLAGCAGSPGDSDGPSETTSTTDTGSANPPDEPRLHRVDIASFAFAPKSLTINVGDTVEWVNMDSAAHTVDSTDGGPLDSGNMAEGATYSFTFNNAGDFAYRCDIHTSMTGSVTVM